MPRPGVLVVDDAPAVRSVLTHCLRQEGFAVAALRRVTPGLRGGLRGGDLGHEAGLGKPFELAEVVGALDAGA